MNFLASTDAQFGAARSQGDASKVLAREAGVSFQLPSENPAGIDPFAEWLSLMEVVQMLCPVWPLRAKPIIGKKWKL